MKKHLSKILLGLALLCLPLLAIAQTNILAGEFSPPNNITGSPYTDAGALIVGLMLVGVILKNAFPDFPNRLIPLCTFIMGTLGYMVMTDSPMASGKAWFTSILVAATATGLHSGLKNTFQVAGEKIVTLAFSTSFFLLVLTGCNTIPKAVVTVDSVVDGAMKEWAMAQRDGRTTPAFDAEVMSLHRQFNKAKLDAAVIWETYLRTGNTSDAASALRILKNAAVPLIDRLVPVNRSALTESQQRLAIANQP